MIREFSLLCGLAFVQIKNAVKQGVRTHPGLAATALSVGGLFYWGFLKLCRSIMSFIYAQEIFGVILATKLIQILMLISVGIVVMSALTTAIANLYMSKDLEFQFSLPVRFGSWMSFRFLQIYFLSCWMVLAFGYPFVYVFLDLSGCGIGIQMVGFLAFAASCSLPVFAATAVCMILVHVFPARRVHQMMLVFTLVLMSCLIFLFRYMEPEKFIGPGGIERFRGYADLVQVDGQVWNPGKWSADFLTAASQGAWREGAIDGFKLLTLVSVLALVTAFCARRLYRPSWDRALQALSGEGPKNKRSSSPRGIARLLGHATWHQEAWELLLFLRDPSQWSQIFVLSALLGLYLFSITKLPLEPFGGTRFQLALGNSGFVAFVCLSVCSRFIFTSFSLEGPALWVIKAAPHGWFRWIRSKLVVFGIPILTFSLLLSLGSGVLLDLDRTQLRVLFLGTVWDALLLIFLSVAFGMLFIDLKVTNPLKLIVSPGGFLLMAVGMTLTGVHVLLRLSGSSPMVNYFLGFYGWPDVQGWRYFAYSGGLLILEVLAIWWLSLRGLRHLRKGEIL